MRSLTPLRCEQAVRDHLCQSTSFNGARSFSWQPYVWQGTAVDQPAHRPTRHSEEFERPANREDVLVLKMIPFADEPFSFSQLQRCGGLREHQLTNSARKRTSTFANQEMAVAVQMDLKKNGFCPREDIQGSRFWGVTYEVLDMRASASMRAANAGARSMKSAADSVAALVCSSWRCVGCLEIPVEVSISRCNFSSRAMTASVLFAVLQFLAQRFVYRVNVISGGSNISHFPHRYDRGRMCLIFFTGVFSPGRGPLPTSSPSVGARPSESYKNTSQGAHMIAPLSIPSSSQAAS